MSVQYKQMMKASVWALVALIAGRVMAGNLDPTNAPAPTMHTLEEIYQKVQNLAPQTLQTLSATTAVVSAGWYSATNLTQVDAELVAENIATNVTIFGVAGMLRTNTYPILLPKTGQATSYATDDDGALQKGIALPNPRFTVQADTNCVLDNLTGLMWARNANLFGTLNWGVAVTNCNDLNYGGYTDWRLPNQTELISLIDVRSSSPALTAGHPFNSVQSGTYWSSTSIDSAKRVL